MYTNHNGGGSRIKPKSSPQIGKYVLKSTCVMMKCVYHQLVLDVGLSGRHFVHLVDVFTEKEGNV